MVEGVQLGCTGRKKTEITIQGKVHDAGGGQDERGRAFDAVQVVAEGGLKDRPVRQVLLPAGGVKIIYVTRRIQYLNGYLSMKFNLIFIEFYLIKVVIYWSV